MKIRMVEWRGCKEKESRKTNVKEKIINMRKKTGREEKKEKNELHSWKFEKKSIYKRKKSK